MLPNHYDPASGKLKLSVHSWFVQVGGRSILIDTCVGNDKERPFFPLWHRLKTPYLDRLAQAGAKPEDVNLVMCTHLHSDHVGWNTRLTNGRWVPTSPVGDRETASDCRGPGLHDRPYPQAPRWARPHAPSPALPCRSS
jgi:glyoxylase-like metal-dependent hydrolase (beta-lactamase superfamily II)